MYYTNALHKCTMHKCTIHKCTIHMHYTHALYTCTIQMHYTNTLYKCTIQIHYTNDMTIHHMTIHMHYTHALYTCTIQIHYTNALHKYTTQMHYIIVTVSQPMAHISLDNLIPSTTLGFDQFTARKPGIFGKSLSTMGLFSSVNLALSYCKWDYLVSKAHHDSVAL